MRSWFEGFCLALILFGFVIALEYGWDFKILKQPYMTSPLLDRLGLNNAFHLNTLIILCFSGIVYYNALNDDVKYREFTSIGLLLLQFVYQDEVFLLEGDAFNPYAQPRNLIILSVALIPIILNRKVLNKWAFISLIPFSIIMFGILTMIPRRIDFTNFHDAVLDSVFKIAPLIPLSLTRKNNWFGDARKRITF